MIVEDNAVYAEPDGWYKYILPGESVSVILILRLLFDNSQMEGRMGPWEHGLAILQFWLHADAVPTIFPNAAFYLSSVPYTKRYAPDFRRAEASARDETAFSR